MIPSAKQCFEFMTQYKMLDNIKEHSIVVEKIARMIAQARVGGMRLLSADPRVAEYGEAIFRV